MLSVASRPLPDEMPRTTHEERCGHAGSSEEPSRPTDEPTRKGADLQLLLPAPGSQGAGRLSSGHS